MAANVRIILKHDDIVYIFLTIIIRNSHNCEITTTFIVYLQQSFRQSVKRPKLELNKTVSIKPQQYQPLAITLLTISNHAINH